MGGAVSSLTAAERPARVKALALFDPVVPRLELVEAAKAGPRDPNFENPMAQGALRRRRIYASRAEVVAGYHGRGIFKTWPDGALADYIEDGFVDQPDGSVTLACAPEWEASNFGAAMNDVWAALGAVHAPVRILRAENGSTCSIESAERFTPANPDFTVQTVAGASHFLPIERPDLVAKTLLSLAG
jgi:pimeloyl-ACP methyl ester carboxylesterase